MTQDGAESSKEAKWSIDDIDRLADSTVELMAVTWCSGCGKTVADAFRRRVAARLQEGEEVGEG